jgi:hypothetical protein
MFYRCRTPPKPKEVAIPIEKKVCAYCRKNRFGLIRHFVGFHHLCTKALQGAVPGAPPREIADYRKLLNRISHNRTVLRYRHR